MWILNLKQSIFTFRANSVKCADMTSPRSKFSEMHIHGLHSLTAIYERLIPFLTHPLSVRYAFYIVYEAVWMVLRPFSSGESVDMAV